MQIIVLRLCHEASHSAVLLALTKCLRIELSKYIHMLSSSFCKNLNTNPDFCMDFTFLEIVLENKTKSQNRKKFRIWLSFHKFYLLLMNFVVNHYIINSVISFLFTFPTLSGGSCVSN